LRRKKLRKRGKGEGLNEGAQGGVLDEERKWRKNSGKHLEIQSPGGKSLGKIPRETNWILLKSGEGDEERGENGVMKKDAGSTS